MSGFDDRYEALRVRFVARCSEDLPVLEAALAGEADAETLRRTVHRLSGAAGTFGYNELSHLAGVVDDRLVEDSQPSEAELTELVETVRVLTRA